MTGGEQWCEGPSPRVAGAAEVEERQGPQAAFVPIPNTEDALSRLWVLRKQNKK